MWPGLIASALAAELPLEDALRRAVQTSEDIAAAEAGLVSAQASQASALSGWLPQVYGSVSYQHTFASEYDDLFETGGGVNPFEDLPFGQDDTWRVDLSLSQGIYQGGAVLATRRLAAAGRTLAETELQGARASTVLSTAEAYFDALLADRLLAIAEATLARAEATLRDATLANELGRMAEFDLLRARVEAENQRVAVIQQRRLAALAHANLRRLLHLPQDEVVSLGTPLGDEAPEGVGELAARVAGVTREDAGRAVVIQAEQAVESAAATVSLTRAQGLPSLGASASYGLVDYPTEFFPDSDWSRNVYAGASLSVPLFAGGYVRSELVGAKADLAAARARRDQAAALAELDERDTLAALEAAAARWEATAGTVAQAEKAFQIAETRFQEGISTQTELADARLLLQQALINRAQAARDLQVARIRLALLPALPVGTSTSY